MSVWIGSWCPTRAAGSRTGLPSASSPVATGWVAARRSARRTPRQPRRALEAADRVVGSVCPYCAVGCGQRVYVAPSDGRDAVTQIEGDPDSPVSRGRLCPKGAASKQLVTQPGPADEGAVPAPVRHRMGAAESGPGDGHDRRPGGRDQEGELAGGARRQAGRRGRWASPVSAAPLWTMRRTTSSRSSGRRSARSRSRTRPAYDTPPLFPVWGQASAVAGLPRFLAILLTRTASSSAAPTWPSAIRSRSSG